ncbi:hypothetical protein NQ117_16625 [Paenibacillus sp. SC116]|uniref:hypothetical protein n=1 Tax=Paenibacillus sp. SC116 TaxID=2968986 RepID=UPI00215B7028|nr:hypothetical protein [Paenibacillus sp. SC116]MCR8845310.1 hypothetical protein [Paenibacillus sp. SC116]
MKKTIISLAAFALLTSAVPLSAQANIITPTNTNETKLISTTDISVLNTMRTSVFWDYYFNGTEWYEYTYWDVTENRLHSSGLVSKNHRYAADWSLKRGNYYSVQIRALNANYAQLATASTGVFRADSAEASIPAFWN